MRGALTPMPTPLQPLTLGELLDRSFQLYRRHFVVVASLVALPDLFVLGIQMAQVALGLERFDPNADPSVVFARLGQMMGFVFIVVVVNLVAGAISQCATMVAVSRIYLDQPISIGGAFAEIRGRLFSLLVLSTVTGILVVFGLIFCIAPGVFLALQWAFVMQSAVLERTKFADSWSRSAFLTSGRRGELFLIYLLFFVLTLLCNGLWQVPLVMAQVSVGPGQPLPTWASALAPVGQYLTTCLTAPLLNIAFTLAYYDARVRKEAFDLQHLMGQIAGPSGSEIVR